MKLSQLKIVALTAVVSLVLGVSAAMAATHATTATATVKVGSSSLGRILVDGRGRTLYLFEKDSRGHSACSGACTSYWPPLLTRAKLLARGSAKQSLLGIIRRSNGRKQVTYAGHPLYRFIGDTRPGQTNGQDLQDFGAGWYVLSPTGKKIEQG